MAAMRLSLPALAPGLSALLMALTALLFTGLAAAPTPARASIELNIDQGVVQPLPISVPAFSGSPLGAQITQVINANLARSGLFRPVDGGALGNGMDVNTPPHFADWKNIQVQALVTGRVSVGADGRLHVDFRLWDVFAEQQLLGLQFTSTPENYRRVAHKISDAIYERLTGAHGYFDTRIVFVAESGPRNNRIRRLAIMDQDGANPQYLTTGAEQVFTPRYSPNSQEVTYMTLRADQSNLYVMNVETGRSESLGRFPGMVLAPRFSPDGRHVAFSSERLGNSDIYVMDLGTHATTRLTTDPAIDTSPSFSPDASHIVFTSDRGGSAELYVMNRDGSGAHRISFGSGSYTTPVWSPDGAYIAFTKQQGGQFHIGVMRPDGSGERILTSSYLDEGPSWSPNGRVIMFSREGPTGLARLWTVDLTGRVMQAAPYPQGASDPAWSPLLN
jgi:TolB protein